MSYGNAGSSPIMPPASPESATEKSTTFSFRPPTLPELMGFGGLIPEILNGGSLWRQGAPSPRALCGRNHGVDTIVGRLAMLGFLAALLAEWDTGVTVLEQVKMAPIPIAIVFAVVAYATWIPASKGCKREPFGWFHPAAEIVNGRLAMIGIIALFLVEDVTGQAFF